MLKVFVPRFLTDEQKAASASLAVRLNPANHIQLVDGVSTVRAVSSFQKRWLPGSTLRVKFLNGSSYQKAKASEQIVIWERYANIRFRFVADGDTDIRVTFYDGVKYTDPTSWSYIGTDAALIEARQPTVNLGWLDDTTDDDEYARVVLHQFGHVLACEDEITHPDSPIKWDAQKVYQFYTSPPIRWTTQQVDERILKPQPDYLTEHSAFDANSIMTEAVPDELTVDGNGLRGGATLSEMDKRMIAELYPFDIPSISVDGKNFGAIFPEGRKEYQLNLIVLRDQDINIKTTLQGGSVSLYSDDGLVSMQPREIRAELKRGLYRLVLRRSWNKEVFFTVRVKNAV